MAHKIDQTGISGLYKPDIFKKEGSNRSKGMLVDFRDVFVGYFLLPAIYA